MAKVLSLTSFPYLFTILIAVVGAQLNYLIEHTLSTPLIEYTLNLAEEPESEQILKIRDKNIQFTRQTYRGSISNITKNQSFKDVQLTIVFPTGHLAKFENPIFEPIPPSALDNWYDATGSRGLEYTITHFQPGFEYRFSFEVLTENINIKPIPYLQSGSTVHLRERSWITKLVRNQSSVNLTIFTILLLVIGIYLLALFFKKETT